MATVLAYAMDQAYTSPRRALLAEFRSSERVQQLFERGLRELETVRRGPQSSVVQGRPGDDRLLDGTGRDGELWNGFPRSFQPVLNIHRPHQTSGMFEP
jgi:hypothetical protein